MKNKLFLALLIICLAASMAAAANTETRDGNTLMLVLDGSTDWDSKVNYPAGLPLFSIAFLPSAADDALTVREKTAAGNRIFSAKDSLGAGLVQYYPSSILFHPYIKASELTLTTPGNARVMLIF